MISIAEILSYSPAGEPDPRGLFRQAAASHFLQTLLLAGAKSIPPAEPRGAHLGDPLFSQWPIASDAEGWVLRIHCFHRDDPDYPHNHRWPWWSLVLDESYWDVSPTTGVQRRRWGDLFADPGDRFHRVELRGGPPAWTLFLHGPAVRDDWHFMAPDGRLIHRRELVSARRPPARTET
jgi:hypothetical protein